MGTAWFRLGALAASLICLGLGICFWTRKASRHRVPVRQTGQQPPGTPRRDQEATLTWGIELPPADVPADRPPRQTWQELADLSERTGRAGRGASAAAPARSGEGSLPRLGRTSRRSPSAR